MAILFGQQHTREELLARIGDLTQVAGVRMMELCDGAERGVRIADVRTGSGLRFQISLDRGMDLSMADYKGVPLAFRSANGDVHPQRYEQEAHGWGRCFPGGLMTGCGMTQVGSPCIDGGQKLGQHGRLSLLPASCVRQETRWEGDECIMEVSGEMREAMPFNENLLLRRTVSVRLGESVITLRDTVCNEGSSAAPLMMLYHVNAGWPIVSEGARLFLRSGDIEPRDDAARAGVADAQRFSAPVAGYQEQVFYHNLIPNEEGFAAALLRGAGERPGLYVRYRQAELPRFVEWKMMGQGYYVVGMEPANCKVEGRARERAAGTLRSLAPGEERHFLVQIGVLEGEDALGHFIEQNGLL